METSLLPTAPQTLTSVVESLTSKQRRFIAVLTLCRDKRIAKRLAGVSRRAWYRWQGDPPFMQAMNQAADLPTSGEAISIMAASSTPIVVDHIIEMAIKPWDECNASTLRTKRWAMEMFLSMVSSTGVKNTTSIKALIFKLGEEATPKWMPHDVIEAEVVSVE